ncbi:MAG: PfkB family carbohydrate kinase [Chromatiales bacterium]|nr:PfkB family carbohydrate kinase [Chromatiales bacterium]
MTTITRPKVFGTGLIALDLVLGPDPDTPVRSWAGGTCGNVLSILAYLGWDAHPIARMNDDVASDRVRADMRRWGVHMDWANCAPTAHTPIIVQEIRRRRDGRTDHRFSWSCPRCGRWLPPFKAITVDAVERVKPALAGASVFFLDRLSRGTLTLAAEASAQGALVVFEPSSKSTDKLLAEAVALAHVVKYADRRLAGIPGVMAGGSEVLIEVQTLGDQGLRYRHRLGRGVSGWMHLKAIPAPQLADTCGAGDWCTAGLIAKAAASGRDGFLRTGARGVRTALRYGQALAAWNCGFEGARGGMYAVSGEMFKRQIAGLLNGRRASIQNAPIGSSPAPVVTCPACPPAPFNLRPAQGRTSRPQGSRTKASSTIQ